MAESYSNAGSSGQPRLRGFNTGTASACKRCQLCIAEAKAKFSELLDQAKSNGPQKITKHGRTTAVIVAAEQMGKKVQRRVPWLSFWPHPRSARLGLEVEANFGPAAR